MTGKWGRFAQGIKRLHNDFEFREVKVYTYSSSYDSNTGEYVQTRSEDANSPVKMELREPTEPTVITDADGREIEIDIRGWLRDDTGVTLEPSTDSDWQAEIEDTLTGDVYTVHETFQEDNGLIKIYGVSI